MPNKFLLATESEPDLLRLAELSLLSETMNELSRFTLDVVHGFRLVSIG